MVDADMGHPPSKDETKEASSNASSDGDTSNHKANGKETTTQNDTEFPQKITPITDVPISPKISSETTEKDSSNEKSENATPSFNTCFRSSAKDALAKAMLLATRQQEKEYQEAAAAAPKQAESKEISIEKLRDLINQHPGEFWQSREDNEDPGYGSKEASNTATISKRPRNNNRIVFEEAASPPHKEDAEDIKNGSGNPAKRRKLQRVTTDQQQEELPPQQMEPIRRNNKNNKVFTLEDRETLKAVRTLLEASLHQQQQVSSTGMGNLAKGLLEQLSRANPAETMELEDGPEGMDIQDMARKVTTSFAEDLSEVLEAVVNAKSCLGDDSNINGNQQLQSPIKTIPSIPTAVDFSLLCDEQDLVQFKDEEDDSDSDDDIIEISKEENYIQQNLMCHERLFGKEPKGKKSDDSNHNNKKRDLLFAQKVALLRETKRLIRSKTLVLTKRRLGIQGDEDLSLVI